MSLSQTEKIKESQLSDDGAIVWAENYFLNNRTWPVRRFRVDGTEINNSHMLRESDAKATQEKYGGEVRELVPTRDDYIAMCEQLGRKCVIPPLPGEKRS